MTPSVRSWKVLNMGLTWRMISAISTSSSGSATRNTRESFRLMETASTRALTSITGARTSRRIPIISVICIILQSLVRRVTREAVENFSMLRKENSWIWSYWARRRLAPKPWPAREDRNAAPMPRPMDSRAIATISRPLVRM